MKKCSTTQTIRELSNDMPLRVEFDGDPFIVCVRSIEPINRDDERYRGYWISGSAHPGPPNTFHWESLGSVLKDRRLDAIIEVVRIQDPGITFDLKGFAEFYGREISRIFVDHCLPSSG